MDLDNLGINVLRGLSLDMITKANSGHPGMALSAAPALYTLYTRHLVTNPENPNWINRDRFVLSAGHASALLYANLHLAGFKISLDQLKQFRQLDSLTPGHPEFGHTPGVDATSGPLGQGIAQAVGLAIAEAHLSHLYKDGEKLINHYTYCMCGDCCLQEGISQEAISLAGLLGLNKLILLYDKNNCTLDGPLSMSSVEDTKKRFEAANWNVLEVSNGNDVEEIDKAITLAKTTRNKPTIIICTTLIGFGSEYQGKNVAHGKAFNAEQTSKTKETLGCKFTSFEIPADAYLAYSQTLASRGKKANDDYDKYILEYKKKNKKEYDEFINYASNNISNLIFKKAPIYDKGYKNSTRNESEAFLNVLSESVKILMGGSADVKESVKTNVKSFINFTKDHYEGQNLNFGIREFAMAAIQNGILLHGGIRTYVGAFLVFADYMKAAMRMSALEKVPAIYLLSHDSIAVGEDGPTHQPIDQLPMIRSIPNFSLFRPADSIELAASYSFAFSQTSRPTAIILSRQDLVNNPSSSFDGALKGGYVVSKEKKTNSFTIIATGSEVNLAIDVQKLLLLDGIDTRVVSLPCFDQFDLQSEKEKEKVFSNPYEKRVFVEMSKGDMLYKYAKHVISIETFGYSAPASKVIEKMGFTPNKVKEHILKIIKSEK